MSTEIEPVAEELYDKLRSRFEVRMLDKSNKPMNGNEEIKPEDAKYFNFVYTDSQGHKFGAVTISLANEAEFVLMIPKDITSRMNDAQRREWAEFLRSMSKFAKRRPNLKYTITNLAKSGHVKNQGTEDEIAHSGDVTVNESKFYGVPGRPRHSVGEHAGIKIRVTHTDPVLDEVRGARSRRIESIYLETPEGERFKVPNNIHAAKAHATHLANYGNPYDEIGECINNMVEEMNAMRRFVRSAKRRPFEDVEAGEMAQHATDRYYKIQHDLKRMTNHEFYDDFVKNYTPEEQLDDDVDLEELRNRFSRRVYDERLDDSLKYVYREHLRQKARKSNVLADEFGEWAESVVFEDDGENDVLDDQLRALQEYCKSAQTAGVDGIDAKTELEPMLQDLPGVDWLLADLTEKANNTRGQGSDYDARRSVKEWAVKYMPEWAKELDFGDHDIDDGTTNWRQQTSPDRSHPNDEYGAANASIDEPIEFPTTAREDADPLDFIRYLSGIKSK